MAQPDMLLAASLADADVEIDVNPAAPLPVAVFQGLNRSKLQLRSVRFSPVAKDCTEALAATGKLLSRQQCMNLLSVQQLRFSNTHRGLNLLQALARFSNLHSLSLTGYATVRMPHIRCKLYWHLHVIAEKSGATCID